MSKICNFLLAACAVAFSALGQTAFKAVTVSTNVGVLGAGALAPGVKLTLSGGVVSNSTAVNLTGSLTNVSIYGGTVIDTGDELQDTVDYGLALTPNGNTPTENDASARPRSVATIASLVADVDPLLVPNYARVSVLGYTSAGDGGGGDFQRVLYSSLAGLTGTNGMWFQSSNNPLYAWVRDWDGGPVNPRWFGAKGDESTDDTAAIQAAIDFAEAPSYGPAAGSPNGNTAEVRLAAGGYKFSNLTITRLTRFGGNPGQLSDINNGTLLYQKAGSIGPAITVAASNTKPLLENFALLGRAEQNATNHVAIVSSSDRHTFTVATNSLPTYHTNSAAYPWFSHCFFYGPADGGTRRYMGSGWVTNIDYATGVVTLRDQTDWYATLETNGLALSSEMAVIFSPLTTNGTWVGYSGAYAPAGNTGIEINGTGHIKVQNLVVEKFHVGILVNAINAFTPLTGCFIRRSQYFSLGAYTAGANSDSFINSSYFQGIYRTDYDLAAETQSVTNKLYRRATFNIMNPGFADDYSQVTFDTAVVNHHQAAATTVQLSGGLNDNAVIGSIWIDGANNMPSAIKSSARAHRSLFLTSISAGEDIYPVNTTNTTYLVRSTSSGAVDLSFDGLDVIQVYSRINNISTNPVAPTYNYGFILPSGSYASVGAVNNLTGLTTLREGASEVRRGAQRDRLTTANEAYTGFYHPSATSMKYAIATNELFSVTSTGMVVGETNFAKLTSPLTVLGGGGGTPVLSLQRESGTSQRWDWRVGTSQLNLYDYTSANMAFTLSTIPGGVQLYGGGASSSSSSVSFGILTKPTSGTDSQGGALSLGAGTGTGAGITGPINFYVPLSHASGTAAQTNYLRGYISTPASSVAGDTSLALSVFDGSNWNEARFKAIPATGELYLGTNSAVAETLTYSGPNVTITAGKGSRQQSQLTCTNDFTLLFSGGVESDAGTVYVAPAATNCTVTLGPNVFGPSGATLTISGGTGNTNYTKLAWECDVIGGTNRFAINALNYYR